MSELKVNTISEVTGANGVVVDSVKLKDGGVIIADAGNIGSASDTDAIAIASNGAVTFSQAASFSSTIASTGAITSNAGVVVDNITIDGTEIDLSSGDLTLDVAGDIILDADGADVKISDGGTHVGTLSNSSSDFVITSAVQDKDIIFKGDDNGSAITALTLDMSAAGKATFNAGIDTSNIITATVGGTGLKSVGANAQVAADASSGYAALISDGAASNSSYIFFQTAGTDKGRITVDQNGNVEIGSGGTTTGLKVDSTGAVTKPLQPAFQATPSSNSSDIAADTSHTIVADTEILDRNGDYNTSNGTFTAPVTGLYHLYISLAVADYDHDNNYSAVFIQTSNRRYTPWLLPGGQFDADGSFYISGSVIADMDANDTATFIFRNDQGTQQPFINQEFTFLGGCLLA